MYHGSRDATLDYYPAICLTDDRESAEAYGEHLHTVTVDRSALCILKISMTREELREAIDDNEWPCDRDADIARYVADGYDAVEYMDVDQYGGMHTCLRILTAAAWQSAVEVAVVADECEEVGGVLTRVQIEKDSGGSYVHVGYLDIDGETYDIVAIGEECISDLVDIASASTMPEGYEWTGDEVFEVPECYEWTGDTN